MNQEMSPEQSHATDWLSEARIGAFMHFVAKVDAGPATAPPAAAGS